MKLRPRNGPAAVAALLLFSLAQIGFQIGFAQSTDTNTPATVPQQVIARLTTRNNQPVMVNGVSAGTGASVLSGATIETGADTAATVNIGPLGTLDIAPNTKLVLTYSEKENVRAFLIFGCAVLAAKDKTSGEITTEEGSAGKTNSAAGGVLRICFPVGTTPPVLSSNGPGGLFGLGRAATIAIFASGGTAALTPFFIQDNPSGSTP